MAKIPLDPCSPQRGSCEAHGRGSGKDYSPAQNQDWAATLVVPDALDGARFDVALAQLLPTYSRSRLQSWIKQGAATLDDKRATPSTPVHAGARIQVRPPEDPALVAAKPEAIALDVVYEDASVLVINKPPGLVVHPGHGNWQGTLLNALLHHAPQLAALPRAGIVHRLDKDTSGLLVIAKTVEAQTGLVRQLQARSVKRDYWVVVRGVPKPSGEIDAPIGRHPAQRTRMAVIDAGRPARTSYRVRESFARHALLEVSLHTGRTHQIRVHMQAIGHPVWGDPVYGRSARAGGSKTNSIIERFGRQALHAIRLELVHPQTRKPMHWSAALPEDMRALLAALRAANS